MNNYITDLIGELGPIKNWLETDFYLVGSVVDLIYLDIDRKIKDIDLVYFGNKDIGHLKRYKEGKGLLLGRKIRLKPLNVWVEIFFNNNCPHNYIPLYDIKAQTKESRYKFITDFLLIEERSSWTNRYRSWFRTKKQYFTLLKQKYEYNNIE